MRSRTLLGLCLIVGLVVATTVALAQNEGGAEKPKPPRFFFEKKGGLAQPGAQPQEQPEQPQPPAVPVPAEPARPAIMPKFDFEAKNTLEYWSTTDPEAILDITTAEGTVHAGNGSLRLTYMPREDAFQQISVSPLRVEEGRTLSFWVRTDLPTPLSFGVVEEGGAFYQQFCATPTDEWTHISIPLDCLILAQGARDDSGQLEAERITEIRIQDLSNLPGKIGDALGRKFGVQQLFLDDVAIVTEDAPVVGTAPAGAVLAEGFERDAIYALAIGGAALQKTEGAQGGGLQIVCPQRAQRWMGFVMGVGHLPLTDTNAVALQLKADKPVTLSLVLEEWDGSKYSQRFKLAAGDTWTPKEFALDDLILETDSNDENAQLDRDQIRVLILVADLAAFEGFPLTIGVDEIVFK